MDKWLETLNSAQAAVRANSLRSFLTALGIAVGVASIIAIVSMIHGLSASINQQFNSLGSNALTITSYTPIRDRLRGDQAKLTHQDLQLIEQRISGISQITPLMTAVSEYGGQVSGNGQTTQSLIFGSTTSYQDLHKRYPATGRFIVPGDDEARRRVAIIGEVVRRELDLPDNPVGKFIQVEGRWFKVIGVMEERGELFGIPQDDYVLIPYQTARTLAGEADEPDIRIQFLVDDHQRIQEVMSQIRDLLRVHHELDASMGDDFKIQTSDQLLETFDSITNMLTLVLGGIVGVSLLVGGIGIMNIMMVSVTERTREIGVLKALGATRNTILGQFLLEALIICLLGGVAGIICGYLVALLIVQLIPNFPAPNVPLWAASLALGFSGAIGLIFGILPAAKAANLDPIQALRYE